MRRCPSLFLLALAGLTGQVRIGAQEAPTVPNSVIVVFNSTALPADAAAQVQNAGGKIVAALPEVGVAVAGPVSVDGATLIARLRRNSTGC